MYQTTGFTVEELRLGYSLTRTSLRPLVMLFCHPILDSVTIFSAGLLVISFIKSLKYHYKITVPSANPVSTAFFLNITSFQHRLYSVTPQVIKMPSKTKSPPVALISYCMLYYIYIEIKKLSFTKPCRKCHSQNPLASSVLFHSFPQIPQISFNFIYSASSS